MERKRVSSLLCFLTLVDDEDDRTKLEQLYLVYCDQMQVIARRTLGKFAYLEEDVVADTFVSLAKHIDRINDVYELRTKAYVFAAVRNTARSYLRHETTLLVESADENIDIPEGETDALLDCLCAKESVDAVRRAIRTLPQLYQDLLILHYFNDLELHTVARILGRKYHTVRKQIYRGKQLLIAELKRRENNEKE